MVNTLREWRLAGPKGELDLVPERCRQGREPCLHRGFGPLQVVPGVVDRDGKPKYSLHAMRHAAAALFIANGISPKRLQAIMGYDLFDLRAHPCRKSCQ